MNKIVHFAKRGLSRAKSMLFALGVCLGFVSVAKAEGTVTAYDISVVSDLSDKLEATLTSFWSDNKDAIFAVIGIIVVISLVWLVLKLWKRGTSKA